MENTWKSNGKNRKVMDNHEQLMETPWKHHEKSWTRHGQIMENHCKAMEKSWTHHGQVYGKLWKVMENLLRLREKS